MRLTADPEASYVDVVFRPMFSLIFIVGGLGHWMQHDVMMARLDASPWVEWVALSAATNDAQVYLGQR